MCYFSYRFKENITSNLLFFCMQKKSSNLVEQKLTKMKKSLLSIAFTGALIGGVFGQLNQPRMLSNGFSERLTEHSFSVTPKALGDTLWEDNFDVPSDWVINNDGQSGVAVGWDINATAESWYFNAINSVSGGNFAEVGNGTDPNAVAATGVTYTITTAAPIDVVALGGSEFINLEFLQYGARFNDAQRMQISTDGITFITVGDNSDKEVLSQTGGAPYPNPDVKRINLSTYLTAAPTQLWIRFLWTSAFPTNTTNGAWITYGWMIDDVKITTLPDNDVRTQNLYFGSEGLPYFLIPSQQIAPIDFSVWAFNNGSNTQHGVQLQASETTAGYTATSPAASIPAGDSAQLVVSNPLTPAAAGPYSVNFQILNDSIDDDPANNQMSSYTFTVGGDLYARDRVTPTGQYNIGIALEGGNLFDIFQNQAITGIDVRFGSTINAGLEIYGILYEVNADFDYISETQTFISGNNMANTWQTLTFASPIMLEAGKTYMVTAGCFADEFSIATSGPSVPQTTFLYGDLGTAGVDWYWAPSTVMVRMNFDPSLSVNNVSGEISSALYPNPANTATTLEIELLNEANISVQVVDVTGQAVYTNALNSLSAGKHAIQINTESFAQGVYFVNINNGAAVTSKKLVINK
jgi:hypothetical protein